MPLDDLLRDEQPQAETGGQRVRRRHVSSAYHQGVEDDLQRVRRNGWPLVHDLDHDDVRFAASRQVDGHPFRAVLDGVVEQIREYLSEPRRSIWARKSPDIQIEDAVGVRRLHLVVRGFADVPDVAASGVTGMPWPRRVRVYSSKSLIMRLIVSTLCLMRARAGCPSLWTRPGIVR